MVNQNRMALITAQQELNRAETNLRELLGITSIAAKQDIDNIEMNFRELLGDNLLSK